MSRGSPSARDTPTDAGYTGSRVPPPRLAPSLAAFLQAVAGGASVQTIPEGTALWVFAAATQNGTPLTAVAVTKGATTLTVQLGPAGRMYLRAADGFTGASWTTNFAFGFLVIDTGLNPSMIDAGITEVLGSVGNTVGQDTTTGDLLTIYAGPQTLIDNEQVVPTSQAAATAETVLQAGANPLPPGSVVEFNLYGTVPIVTVADDLVYVALKGHASAIYYAVCPPGVSMSGRFVMAQGGAGEKLDIVARNQDTAAHAWAAFWEGYK